MKFSADDTWQLRQVGFDRLHLSKTEAIMALGNGYLGTRSAEEESYLSEQRDTLVAGTFNLFHPSEVTELPNAADIWATRFVIDDLVLSLVQGTFSGYSKRLNLRTGELTREFEWQLDHRRIRLTFRRFVSKARRHLMLSLVTMENLGADDLKIEVRAGIDGRHTNGGSQHFTEGQKGLVAEKYLQMMPTTTQSGITFVHTLADDLQAGGDVASLVGIERREIFWDHAFKLRAGGTATLQKRGSVYTTIDADLASREVEDIRAAAVAELDALADRSFDDILAESARAWQDQVWSVHPVTIDTDNFRDQLAIRFAQYHLHAMVPAHDERMNIAANGLTGELYKGHSFWDTEVFMLPYFVFTHPQIARSLVSFRHRGLEAARKKAAAGGYRGALYPWEAAWPSDGEVTPLWGQADIVTGQQTRIWSGVIEQHISSDVAFGVKLYLDVTGDQDWAEERGYEILLDTALFWASRLEWDAGQQRFEINDVIGADEYHEHVNNNAFTNYSAHWNMTLAIALLDQLREHRPQAYARLDAKFGLQSLRAELADKEGKIYLPKPKADGIIPQDDTYLSKRTIDLTKYKALSAKGKVQRDYNLDQISDMQVTKQADVLLLLFMHEDLFGPEFAGKNFDYYERRTVHDSSLSLSTHAILAAGLGRLDVAYDFFTQARDIDMGDYMNSSDGGVHAASLGGIWQMVVLGFGGLRIVHGKLRIEPHLPPQWRALTYGFTYRGEPVTVTVTDSGFTLSKADNGNAVSFLHGGREREVTSEMHINFES